MSNVKLRYVTINLYTLSSINYGGEESYTSSLMHTHVITEPYMHTHVITEPYMHTHVIT